MKSATCPDSSCALDDSVAFGLWLKRRNEYEAKHRRIWTFLGAALVILLASGCAATRSTINVPISRGGEAAATPKAYVKIVQVNDARKFEANPRNPSVPSLQNPEELNDSAIKSRAIARKRGGFGMAMADILLPEGRTVEQLVREAATNALRERGYGIVDDKAPEQEKVLPLDLEIQQFWSWFSPGFFAIKLQFESIVVMKSEALLDAPQETVCGYR